MSKVTYAKHYYIANAKIPDLNKCWSACNGIDGLGHAEDDDEMLAARRRHGECLKSLPGAPRLILYRKTKDSPLKAKLWFVRSITNIADPSLLGSLAKTCYAYGDTICAKSPIDVYLIDWGAVPKGCDTTQRFEISIEVIEAYKYFRELKAEYRRFMKHFDKGVWK
jgi:hypothetical protein